MPSTRPSVGIACRSAVGDTRIPGCQTVIAGGDKRRRKRRVIAALVAIGLAACGTAGEPAAPAEESSENATPTPSPTATPEPTPIPTPRAARTTKRRQTARDRAAAIRLFAQMDGDATALDDAIGDALAGDESSAVRIVEVAGRIVTRNARRVETGEEVSRGAKLLEAAAEEARAGAPARNETRLAQARTLLDQARNLLPAEVIRR